MSRLDVFSKLDGGEDELRVFFAEHAVLHQLYAQQLATTYNVQVPLFDLNDDHALEELLAVQRGDRRVGQAEVLQAWLRLHNNLHAQELAALGSQVPQDFESADFGDPQQFQDWFYAHELVHDQEDTALGL